MTGKTHLSIGAASVWLLVLLPGFTPLGALPVIALFAALFPDIEARESKIKHFGYKGFKPLLPFGIIFHGMFKHRGFTHSLLFGLILYAVGVGFWYYYQFPYTYVLAGVVGFYSHSFLDSLTKAGIYFWWPFKKTFRLLPRKYAFKTGGYIDELLFVAGLLAVLYYYLVWWSIAGTNQTLIIGF